MLSARTLLSSALTLLAFSSLAAAQSSPTLPSSYPHSYPGQPSGDYSPAWQKYFRVTDRLPGINFPLSQSYAGNIDVQRAGHLNNTLFFYGFEKSKGSLTASPSSRNRDPWGIWLNGGPGSSSMFGLFFENGPIRINGDYSLQSNPYSWDKLADYFWIDQPVSDGRPDWKGLFESSRWVSWATWSKYSPVSLRDLHLTGESFAGQYIPYILKAYFDMPNPPVKIAKIAIGAGTYTSEQVFELLPALSVIETFPQIIGYDKDVFNYFKEQTALCGFDVNLTYPQNGIIPDVELIFPTDRDIPWALQQRYAKKTFLMELTRRAEEELHSPSLVKRNQVAGREQWKRDLSLRANGTIDPWYGCFLLDMFIDYALNYTFPWTLTDNPEGFPFNVYNIPDALNPKVPQDASVFLNDPRTRAALHAPTSKDWSLSFRFPFGANPDDGTPMSINIFTDLATNATAKGVKVVLFSGNDDALIPHLVAIQNTTFGGIQGFTQKPSTPWYSDSGKFAGVVHQERGWTYALFYGAGHLVPLDAPANAFTFLREFILGNNMLGTVVNTPSGRPMVIGGQNPALEGAIQGADEIYYGYGATQSTYVFPSATRDAWKAFIDAERPQETGILSRITGTSAARSSYDLSWVTLLLAGLTIWFQL
ncbi:hypothetical protein NLJ89_g4887 [Agrocybe chaxingu]|uniref:Uncharacterized protein n=1 Tax=Agrocybe chaxingu TaxID=84603 RepID=A0A9W8MXN6_9AGAR|nr:hypothetical protein NLJ89_g4887 [Agrocybe chaxingu]